MPFEQEIPSVDTPWIKINQLLSKQERFKTLSGYVLAPRTTSTLSALLYLLKEENLAFTHDFEHQTSFSIKISLRHFDEFKMLPNDCIKVGTGLNLSTLNGKLFQEKMELGLEDLSQFRSALMGSYVLKGAYNGVLLNEMTIQQRLLEVNWVNFNGDVIKWGHYLPNVGGPLLMKLMWGLKKCPGILTSVIWKVNPAPLKRIFLNWDFLNEEEGWKHLQVLKSFTNTWERLDLVLSPNSYQKHFLLAQISGLEEEMESFILSCPLIEKSHRTNMVPVLKQFFDQQSSIFKTSSEKPQIAYRWYHSLTDQTWWIDEELDKQELIVFTWQERLYQSLIH